jgi:hypothetical protein
VRGGDVTDVVFHSDKGGEYVGDLFAQACAALGVTQSMGRVGSALDNAAAESWNSTLEHELLSRRRFETKDEARRAVARFIDAYNHRRRHSSCETSRGRRRSAGNSPSRSRASTDRQRPLSAEQPIGRGARCTTHAPARSAYCPLGSGDHDPAPHATHDHDRCDKRVR